MLTCNLIIMTCARIKWLVLLFSFQNVAGFLRGRSLPRLWHFLVFLSPTRQLSYNVMLASSRTFLPTYSRSTLHRA